MAILSRMADNKLVTPTIGTIWTGSHASRMDRMLLAKEARKRIGPTNARINRIANPRPFQTGRRLLTPQTSFKACVKVLNTVEADQSRPSSAAPVTGPRAVMISSIFFPNN